MTVLRLFFQAHEDWSCDECLRKFIQICRESSVLNASAQFDANVWEHGPLLKGKNNECRVIFSTREAAQSRSRVPCMDEKFLPFAKSILVYRQSIKPVISQSTRLSALRYLEAALRQCGKDCRPNSIDSQVLDSAVALVRSCVTADVAYRTACELEAIADLMRAKRLIHLRERWLHGMRRPDALGSRISPESVLARQTKCPSVAAIRAIGGVFQVAQGVSDKLTASSGALLLCAPDRINEVTRLRRNCIVLGEGRFEGKVGIRWPGSKGAKNTTKWIPKKMAGVAQDAVRKLNECTTAGHKLACWYVSNPKSIFIHEDATHLRGQASLTYEDVALLLWGRGSKAASAKQWCRANGIKMAERRRKNVCGYVSFADVERVILGMLPSSFPHLPGDSSISVHEALYIVRKNELHATNATYECLFDVVDQGDIASRLGQRNDSGIPSIFVKYEYSEDDGTPIHLKTHAPRHYLNTGAQMAGLSSSEISAFSGRRDERQNQAYDHMTSDEVQQPIKTAIKQSGFMGGLVDSNTRHLVTRAEFSQKGVETGHTTEYGHCVHNFASEPCHLHRDCINCEELECVKGEKVKETNLRALKAETEHFLLRAKVALSLEEFGADAWVAHQEQTLERVNSLLARIDDPEIPIGARIRLVCDPVPVIGHTVSNNAKTIKLFRTRALK